MGLRLLHAAGYAWAQLIWENPIPNLTEGSRFSGLRLRLVMPRKVLKLQR